MHDNNAIGASFRDPSGFIFQHEGELYRQIDISYKRHYDHLMSSGLYEKLIKHGLLIEHKEISQELRPPAYKVIKPVQLNYISYPYEWCFSQLKDAALVTLRIQAIASKHGMWIKDASAFNIQFHNGKPVMIDTLSLEIYEENQPWPAYRQFCQHFLAPLALVAHCDYQLMKLLRTHIDGIPLPLASRILPGKTWFKYSLLSHIHLHAKAQRKYANSADDNKKPVRKVTVSPLGLRAMIDSLHNAVNSMSWAPGLTEWGDYYADTNYDSDAMRHKEALVADFLSLSAASNNTVIDLGANNGKFTRIAMGQGKQTIAMDVDEVAVELNYKLARDSGEKNILPLVQDLTNPSPSLGWAHDERMSLIHRGPAETVMALALIHHLAISNNVPLDKCAEFFAQMGEQLIIEFVPKGDSQVDRLLTTRVDIFPNYTQDGFEMAFMKFFTTIKSQRIESSDRILYLLRKKH